MEQFLRLTILFDLYGALLTEKQRECLSLHLLEDFSLTEIGESMGISRQAVHDTLHRSEKAMEDYEAKLGLAARYQAEQKALDEIYQAVKALRREENAAAVDAVLDRLMPMIGGDREGIS